MAKHLTSLSHSRNLAEAFVVPRYASHKILEGFLLFSACGILCVLFAFFAFELKNITVPEARVVAPLPTEPPHIEARVIDTSLYLMEIGSAGDPIRIISQSSLVDAITDFTLFAVPQHAYQGTIYVRPLIEGDLSQLSIYPIDVATGNMNPAIINAPADLFALSPDQTRVALVAQKTLSLYDISSGSIIFTRALDTLPLPSDAYLFFRENDCVSLMSTSLAEELTSCP